MKNVFGVRDGLLAWAAMVWPQAAASTLGRLADCLEDPSARRVLGELERYLYGRAPGTCDPAMLTAAVRSIKRAVRKARHRELS